MLNFFHRIENYVAFALVGLMAVVVVSAILEVAYVIVTSIFTPPGYFVGVEDLFDIFGLFLMVLIGLELMTGVLSFVQDHTIHAELMLLVAMTAVTRKIVIMDAKEIDPLTLFGVGFIIIALAVGYYLIRRSKAAREPR